MVCETKQGNDEIYDLGCFHKTPFQNLILDSPRPLATALLPKRELLSAGGFGKLPTAGEGVATAVARGRIGAGLLVGGVATAVARGRIGAGLLVGEVDELENDGSALFFF